MTLANKVHRWLMFITFIVLIIHALLAHHEQQQIISALTDHQQHSIAAFAQINTTLAKGIVDRAEAQQQRDEAFYLHGAETPIPTQTPKVVIKHHTKIIRPTPKPFRLFGPN